MFRSRRVSKHRGRRRALTMGAYPGNLPWCANHCTRLSAPPRSKIGAHYTSRQDILTLVEPVVMQPLRREWHAVRDQCDQLWPKIQFRKKPARVPAPAKAAPPLAKTPRPEKSSTSSSAGLPA